MIEGILIPVDFSQTALAAARYGCALAARLGARATLLHVFSPRVVVLPDAVFVPSPEEIRALADAARDRLQSLAADLARDGQEIDCIAVEGQPAEAIRLVAEQQRAGLIVMGTHGRRGVAHLLLGSVAERLLRRAPCPVLTVGRACVRSGHAAVP